MPHIILFLNDQRACGVKRGQGLSKRTIFPQIYSRERLRVARGGGGHEAKIAPFLVRDLQLLCR